MKEFTTFLTETKNAIDYETYITVAFNGGLDKDSDTLSASKLDPKDYKANESNANKIASVIKKATGAKTLTHIGSATGKMVSWWEGAATPKTDVYTNNGINISLKSTNTSSQLTSGKIGETRSIFRAALKHSHDAEAEKLSKLVLDTMKEFVIPKAKRAKINIHDFTTKAKAGKKMRDKELNSMADEFIEADKMRVTVTKQLNKYFENDSEFRKWFVYEAATGQTKFSPEGKNGKSIANYVVKFNSATGEVEQAEALSKSGNPTKIINDLASKVNFRVSWKTPHGTGPSTYLALRGDILEAREMESTIWEMIDNEFNTLNENVINSIEQFFTNMWNKIIKAISSAAKKGYEYLISYMGFDVNALNISVSGLEY